MPKAIEAQTYNILQVKDALRETGQLIATERKERGWSQSELGQRLGGIDRRHISAMEKGDANSGFGLVVSALWVLDIPVLETLTTNNHDAHASRARPVLAKRNRMVGKPRKKVISNDF